jgi:hypothetical protein
MPCLMASAKSHDGGSQGWVNADVNALLRPTDELREGRQHVLHADGAAEPAIEEEVDKKEGRRSPPLKTESNGAICLPSQSA